MQNNNDINNMLFRLTKEQYAVFCLKNLKKIEETVWNADFLQYGKWENRTFLAPKQLNTKLSKLKVSVNDVVYIKYRGKKKSAINQNKEYHDFFVSINKHPNDKSFSKQK